MDLTVEKSNLSCHICHSPNLNLHSTYNHLPRVASDCVPWRSGGRLASCPSCLCVQNPVDTAWHKETTEIYSKYKLYKQSAGSEQGVVNESKQLLPRSAKIFQSSAAYLEINKKGRLLDIGCANGELLRCFSTIAPHWEMVGFEIDDKCRQEVESIPGVVQFASGSLEKVTGSFDIITLMHVLEHLPDPVLWLKNLHKMLNPNGMVLIQVPDPKINPYNLLVADHCSHFIMSDLIRIAEQANYEVIAYSDKWVMREFSILITPVNKNNSNKIKKAIYQFDEMTKDKIPTYPINSIKWLYDIVNLAKAFPVNKPRGVWGTAIAGTWLYSILDCNVDFFVDEDVSRIGQEHLGKPIYSPENAPKDSNVFVALTPEIASNIVNRWSHLALALHQPPKLIY